MKISELKIDFICTESGSYKFYTEKTVVFPTIFSVDVFLLGVARQPKTRKACRIEGTPFAIFILKSGDFYVYSLLLSEAEDEDLRSNNAKEHCERINSRVGYCRRIVTG
jgi:hypothetical protein